MRSILTYVALAVLTAAGSATTLQRLSLDDMIVQSSQIARGKVRQTNTELRGSIIFTHYQLQVTDQWKGPSASQVDFAVPGGVYGGLRQTYSGAPTFVPNKEYILFLWTSRTGLTQVIGLSQGLFAVVSTASGELYASRSGATDRVVDASGNDVNDPGFSMSLSDLRSHVAQVLASATKGGQ